MAKLFFFLSPLVRLVQFNKSHSVVSIQCKLTFHPFTLHYYIGWKFMTKHTATPFAHIGSSNILESSMIADVSTYQKNQHHLISFMEQKEIHPGLQEIRLWGYKSVKEWKVPPPHPTTGFVSFMSIKIINPLATTEGRGRQMMDLYNPPCHSQELILKRNWNTWAKIHVEEESVQQFYIGPQPLIHRSTAPKYLSLDRDR